MTTDLKPYAIEVKQTTRGRRLHTWVRFAADAEAARADALRLAREEFDGRAVIVSVRETTVEA